MSKKKIGWLVDVNVFSGLGSGSERTDRFYIEEGIRRGHNIDVLTPDTPFNIHNYDLFVVSNCTRFSRDVLEKVVEKPTVFFLHDFGLLCHWNLYYPKLEKCKNCINKPSALSLLQKSKLIIWLSPLHREDWLFACPELEDHSYLFVPSGIDPDEYGTKELDTKEDCCAVNILYEFKGRDQAIEYINNHLAYKFHIIGDNPDNVQLPENTIFHGRIDNNKLRRIYQTSECLLHLPNREPCSRVVIEYLLSNPKGHIIGNDKIGILSYDDIYDSNGVISREKLKKLLMEAPEKFWSEVETLCG